jgi:hypothetical protein
MTEYIGPTWQVPVQQTFTSNRTYPYAQDNAVLGELQNQVYQLRKEVEALRSEIRATRETDAEPTRHSTLTIEDLHEGDLVYCLNADDASPRLITDHTVYCVTAVGKEYVLICNFDNPSDGEICTMPEELVFI